MDYAIGLDHSNNHMHMNTWTRCGRCGAINDHDANVCYLCGTAAPLQACSACGADFVNPLDAGCPSCGKAYEQIRPREQNLENCGDHRRESYLEP